MYNCGGKGISSPPARLRGENVIVAVVGGIALILLLLCFVAQRNIWGLYVPPMGSDVPVAYSPNDF